MKQNYFVLDDYCESLGREGYVVMYGDPHTAIGVRMAEKPTLHEALAYCGRATKPVEIVYRVKLARRHERFSCRPVARHLMCEPGANCATT